jgi:hypothetical protein
VASAATSETRATQPDLSPAAIAALPFGRGRRREGESPDAMRADWLLRTRGRAHELVEELIRIQREMESAGQNATPAALAAWLRNVSEAFPDDTDVQMNIADAFALLCGMSRLTETPDSGGFCAETQSRAANLAQAHPELARPHRLLGQMARNAGDSVGAMREYARCVRLDAAQSTCVGAYNLVRETYTRPYCEQAAVVNNLRIFSATTSPSAGQARPSFDFHEQHYYTRARALFAKEDILRATALTPEGNMLQLQLTSEAHARVAAAIAEEREDASALAFELRLYRRHVGAGAPMGDDAPNHAFVLSGDAGGVALRNICQTVTVPEVPADAELPAAAAAPTPPN